MHSYKDLLSALSSEHREALQWFHAREGSEVPWPKPLSSGLFLANKAKGIHKPKGWKYALSVRQVVDGSYADTDPISSNAGGWTYNYFQEGKNPAERDRYFTNRALVACMHDKVPIGVLRQTRPSPQPRYKVLGVALVDSWTNGLFLLRSLTPSTAVTSLTIVEVLETARETDPTSLEDARRRIEATIVLRRGQSAFRDRLLEAYGRRCAITGCDAEEALEAAHIVPYKGEHTNLPSNGILLRADLHTLFDLGLLTIDPASFSVVLHQKLHLTAYRSLLATKLRVPEIPIAQPNSAAIEQHYRNALKSWELHS
jgi:putative restriction endonuclease